MVFLLRRDISYMGIVAYMVADGKECREIFRIFYRIRLARIEAAAAAPQIKASLLICYSAIYRENLSRLRSRKLRMGIIRISAVFSRFLCIRNASDGIHPPQSVSAYSHLHAPFRYPNPGVGTPEIWFARVSTTFANARNSITKWYNKYMHIHVAQPDRHLPILFIYFSTLFYFYLYSYIIFIFSPLYNYKTFWTSGIISKLFMSGNEAAIYIHFLNLLLYFILFLFV